MPRRLALLPLLLPAAAAAAQQPSGEGAFVFLLRGDTLGVERYTVAQGTLSGEVTMRGQPRVTYVATFAADGRATQVALAAFAPGSGADAAPLQRADARLVGDSVIVELVGAGGTTTQRVGSHAAATLFVNASAAMTAWLVERGLAGGDSTVVPVFLTTGGATVPAMVRRAGADSAQLQLGPQAMTAALRDGMVVVIRAPGQGLEMRRVTGPAARDLALGRPDYSAPAGAPYTAVDVTVPTPAGHTLAGTFTRPAGDGRVPAVVTITGSGAQDRDEHIPAVPGFRPFRQVADTLGRRGIAVLRLDDRGTGASGGDFAAATSLDFADDVRAAVAWLRARPDVDPDRIALLGHSEGGLIAPLVAADDPRLAAIVLLAAPAQTGRQVIEYQVRQGAAADTTLGPAARDSAARAFIAGFDSTAARTPWMRFFLDHDPLAVAPRVRVPTLILQGATDRQVTADQAETLGAAIRAGGNADVTVRVYPDRNHLFLHDPDGSPAGYGRLASGRIGAEVMGEIAEWLVGRLR